MNNNQINTANNLNIINSSTANKFVGINVNKVNKRLPESIAKIITNDVIIDAYIPTDISITNDNKTPSSIHKKFQMIVAKDIDNNNHNNSMMSILTRLMDIFTLLKIEAAEGMVLNLQLYANRIKAQESLGVAQRETAENVFDKQKTAALLDASSSVMQSIGDSVQGAAMMYKSNAETIGAKENEMKSTLVTANKADKAQIDKFINKDEISAAEQTLINNSNRSNTDILNIAKIKRTSLKGYKKLEETLNSSDLSKSTDLPEDLNSDSSKRLFLEDKIKTRTQIIESLDNTLHFQAIASLISAKGLFFKAATDSASGGIRSKSHMTSAEAEKDKSYGDARTANVQTALGISDKTISQSVDFIIQLLSQLRDLAQTINQTMIQANHA